MKLKNTEELIRAARREISSGTLETAETIAASILAEQPANLDALEIRALVEVERGEHAAAEKSLRSAIAIAPDRRWPYADLARLLIRLERKRDAEDVAHSALESDAANPDAHAMLGTLLAERGLAHEAAVHFEHAIAATGPHPQLMAGLGRALLGQGRLEEARAPLEAAAKAEPDALAPAIALAELEERLGRFGEAKEQLDRAERIARGQGTDVDLQRSVLFARAGAHDEALGLLERRNELSGGALLQRGRLLELAGRHAEAWADWTRGKAMLADKAGRHYRAADVKAEAEKVSAFISAALPRADLRRDVPQPLFIIGFPRSGTTLTEQILASHSRIRAGGELPFGSELFELATALAGGEANFPGGLASVPHWPTRLRDYYLARAEQYGLLAAGAAYFTDKMPANDFWLPLLRAAFPESPVVLVRRHPLDVLTSVMAHDMTHGFDCAYRIEDAARHLALTDRLLEACRGAGVGPSYELRYERLVVEQQIESERLMAAIGFPLEPAQLSFHERATVSPTPSYAQVREPLNDRSISRWRNFARELEAVRPVVAEAIERNGYAG